MLPTNTVKCTNVCLQIYDIAKIPNPMYKYYYDKLLKYGTHLGEYGEFYNGDTASSTDHCAGLGITANGHVFPIFIGQPFAIQGLTITKTWGGDTVLKYKNSYDYEFPAMHEDEIIKMMNAQLNKDPNPFSPVIVAVIDFTNVKDQD